MYSFTKNILHEFLQTVQKRKEADGGTLIPFQKRKSGKRNCRPSFFRPRHQGEEKSHLTSRADEWSRSMGSDYNKQKCESRKTNRARLLSNRNTVFAACDLSGPNRNNKDLSANSVML
ncbi:hypothetical protein CEXT_782281 [Caerostris extrusa]|uniref:Uncharacterized protein n=1 Tax=Caerostris extrusa TaxID=172846 RepID=A0AAV4PZC7_CAEEX|nr:hypothetical protein CEXT_782281 [Caerostris extrusa]